MVSIIENINLKSIKTLDDLSNITTKEEIKNKSEVLSYLKTVTEPTMIAPKILRDAITNETYSLGHSIYEYNGFIWNTMIIYYFEKYNLKLSNDFLKMFD